MFAQLLTSMVSFLSFPTRIIVAAERLDSQWGPPCKRDRGAKRYQDPALWVWLEFP